MCVNAWCVQCIYDYEDAWVDRRDFHCRCMRVLVSPSIYCFSLFDTTVFELHYYWMQTWRVAYWTCCGCDCCILFFPFSTLVIVVVQLFIVRAYRLIIINCCYY